MSKGVVTILVAIAYALIGRIALTIAIEPGFATPIFPPAGIAAAAAIVWGWPAIAGVALGSLIMNLTLQTQFDGSALAIGVSISMGATAQAALARALVRRFVAKAPDLRRDSELIKFALATGPLSCLLNAALSPLVLHHFGRIPADQLVNSMLNWYVGDSVGALFFATLVYVWLTDLPKASRVRTFTIPLVAGFGCAVAAYLVLESNRRADIDTDLSKRTQELQKTFEEVASTHALALQAVRGLFDASKEVDRGEFRIFTREILTGLPEISALSWLPRVTRENRASWEGAMTAELSRPVALFDSERRPRGDAPTHFPVAFIEGRDFGPIFGFDFLSEPVRAMTAAAAIARRETVATRPIQLVQNSKTAIIEVKPVFRESVEPLGLISAIVLVDEFVSQLLPKASLADDLRMTIEDVTDPDRASIHKDADWEAAGVAGATFERSFERSFFGRLWRISIRPSASFLAAYQGRLSLLGWWIATFLCVTSLLGFMGRHESVKRLVEEQTNELTRTNERLQRLAKEKTELLANMSHEIRTPLNGVIGLTQILLERELPSAERAIAKNIATCGRSVLGVINDILDVSRMEAGKLTLAPEPFSVRKVVGDAMAIVQAAAEEKRLMVTGDVDGNVPDVLICDPQRYQQILLNLLSNAVKFTEQGAIGVTVSAVNTADGNVELLTRVTDTGIGLTEAGMRLIFGRFEQAAFPSAASRPTGSGLGLSIARNMAQLMGGRIWVDSEIGRGSTFSFTVAATPGEAASAPTGAEAAAPAGLRILVAEDESVNQLVIRTFLEKSGYRPEFAANGREAIDIYKAKGPFDVVLMDVHMPLMSGLEATRALRADPDVASQPRIVALTAALLEEERASYMQAGMDAVLAKPLERERLLTLLNELASHQAQPSRVDETKSSMPVPMAASGPTESPAKADRGRLGLAAWAVWMVAFYAAILFGRAMSASEVGFVTFWPPSGILLAALLLSPRRAWWSLLASAFLVNSAFNILQGGFAPVAATVIALGNALGVFVIGALLARGEQRDTAAILERHRLPKFLGAVAFAGAPVSATLGAMTLRLSNGLEFGPTWAAWWTADILSLALATPLAVAAHRELRRRRVDRADAVLPKRFGELLGLVTALTAVGLLALSKPANVYALVLFLPILLVATLRLRGGMLVSVHGAAMLLLVRQPLFGTGVTATVIAQLVYVSTLAASLYVAALLRDNRLRTRRLKEARARAERETEARRDFLVRLSHDLRTPIHGILGSVDALRDLSLGIDEQKHLSTLRESAWRLEALFERIVLSRNSAIPALAPADRTLTAPAEPAPAAMTASVPKRRWEIDIATIQRRHDCDAAFVATIARRFRELAPAQLSQLGDAVRTGDARAAHIAAHTLKGMVANFYCEELVERCRLVELAGTEGRIALDTTALASLEQDMIAFADAVVAASAALEREAAG